MIREDIWRDEDVCRMEMIRMETVDRWRIGGGDQSVVYLLHGMKGTVNN